MLRIRHLAPWTTIPPTLSQTAPCLGWPLATKRNSAYYTAVRHTPRLGAARSAEQLGRATHARSAPRQLVHRPEFDEHLSTNDLAIDGYDGHDDHDGHDDDDKHHRMVILTIMATITILAIMAMMAVLQVMANMTKMVTMMTTMTMITMMTTMAVITLLTMMEGWP